MLHYPHWVCDLSSANSRSSWTFTDLDRGEASNIITGLAEDMVEGVYPREKTNGLLVARSLASVSPLNEVANQVANLRVLYIAVGKFLFH